MKKIFFASAVVLLIAAGCNPSKPASVKEPVTQNPEQAPAQIQNQTPPATATPNPAPTVPKAPVPAPAQVKTVLKLGANSTLGQYLIASNDMTLYYYSNDTPGVSNCFGDCAANWPPYTVSADAQLAATRGITGKIGVISRPDGALQLTYNNKPLYFWINGTKAGDTSGNQVGGFFVARP